VPQEELPRLCGQQSAKSLDHEDARVRERRGWSRSLQLVDPVFNSPIQRVHAAECLIGGMEVAIRAFDDMPGAMGQGSGQTKVVTALVADGAPNGLPPCLRGELPNGSVLAGVNEPHSWNFVLIPGEELSVLAVLRDQLLECFLRHRDTSLSPRHWIYLSVMPFQAVSTRISSP
jgi:hypothetical protein